MVGCGGSAIAQEEATIQNTKSFLTRNSVMSYHVSYRMIGVGV